VPTRPRTVVIVEGETDRVALVEAARRLGRDLDAERVAVTPIGGAHAITRFLRDLEDQRDVTIAGLCDEAEEPIFRSALQGAGYGSDLSGADLERAGFFVCRADLEDELIRAVGIEAIERLTGAEGDARAWSTFRRQPAWHGQPTDQQFRRFVRSVSTRNVRYIRAIVDALDPEHLPHPLASLLARVTDADDPRTNAAR